MSTPEKKLRDALKGNAAFSLISGIILISYHGKVGQVMNIKEIFVLQLVGIGLLLFVAMLLYNAFRKTLDIKQVKIIIVQDWSWVLGSMVLLIIEPFDISNYGNLIIAMVALAVMLFAIWQGRAFKAFVKSLKST
jgi:hypothetical protein